jgi:hypothetical protein
LWKHLDYRLYSLKDPNFAPDSVAERYTRKGEEVETTFWNFERIRSDSWKPAAIVPRKLPT